MQKLDFTVMDDDSRLVAKFSDREDAVDYARKRSRITALPVKVTHKRGLLVEYRKGSVTDDQDADPGPLLGFGLNPCPVG